MNTKEIDYKDLVEQIAETISPYYQFDFDENENPDFDEDSDSVDICDRIFEILKGVISFKDKGSV